MWLLLFLNPFSSGTSYSLKNLPGGEGKVLVLPLHDDEDYMVDAVQAEFLIAALDAAEEKNYDSVILSIDTYGGIIHSAREINERLLRLGIPVTAYVEKKAISAGTFIAFACNEIVMEEMTTLGDAQVIMQTEGGFEEAPEKVVTVFRSDWKKACDTRGHSFSLVQGFFDVSAEVLLVGDPDQRQFLLREEYEALPEEERPAIQRVVSKAGQLLTLHAAEAEELGLARVFPDFDSFLAADGVEHQAIVYLDMEWNHRILRFLGANSWIFVLLTLIGLNGIYTELKTPGFGVPGFTAIVCFAIVFGTRYILGTASGLEISIFALGLLLCAAEIFLTPGVGLLGVGGLLCVLAALVWSFLPEFGPVPTVPSHPLEFQILGRGFLATFSALILSFGSFAFALPLFLKIPAVQRRLLGPVQDPTLGWVMDTVEEETLLGQQGVVEGGLRPAGRMRLPGGRLLEVSSQEGFLEHGAEVRVEEVQGNLILVRRLEENRQMEGRTS
jgi:membrane-bound serine protease (ClpP class)